MLKTALLALRNLNRQKKRSFLLGGAIAFGLMIVSLINSFAASFVENVGENFSQLLAGHIFVTGMEMDAEGNTNAIVRDDRALIAALADAGISPRYLTRRTQFRGTLLFQGKSVSLEVTGADWKEESFFKERLLLVQGSFETMLTEPQGIILPDTFARKLKAELGDRLTMRLRTIDGQFNAGDFVVTAIAHDPGLFGSLSAYGNRRYINELLGLGPDQYQILGVYLKDLPEMLPASRAYYSALEARVSMFPRTPRSQWEDNPFIALFMQRDEERWAGTRYRLYTLNDVLQEVQQIATILNQAGLIILLVLFVIIMVGVTNTFRMIMIERVREIGTMRALGMQRDRVRLLFLLEAVFLALGGAVAGLLLAGIIMAVLSRVSWGLDSAISVLLKNGHMTFRLMPEQVLLHVGILAVLTMLAAFLPARNAARLRPVDALR
ncbi:MAG: ABC transporter permease [Planctomycetota bacterium]